MITHNAYPSGVQSLVTAGFGYRVSYGFVPAGQYQFDNELEEHITVLDGEAKINGQRYQVGEICKVQANQGVYIETTGFGYRCEYH